MEPFVKETYILEGDYPLHMSRYYNQTVFSHFLKYYLNLGAAKVISSKISLVKWWKSHCPTAGSYFQTGKTIISCVFSILANSFSDQQQSSLE